MKFWEDNSLDEMSETEWESLCDGCGLCCIVRLEDEDTGEMALTNVACSLLDLSNCKCSDYKNRFWKVPDCQAINTNTIASLTWLPESCAYRRIYLGKDLENWHHLISGDKELVHKLGISKRGKLVSEKDVDDLEDHVVNWLNEENG